MNYLTYLTDKQREMLDLLKTLVEYESPSRNKAACDKLAVYLAGLMESLGCTIAWHRREHVGDHFSATYGEGSETVLILCHYDTVWPVGELDNRPFKVAGGLAYGPGIYDMKGGIAQALYALMALQAVGAKVRRKIVFLFNSDEEIGSASSRELIETTAKAASFVLVPEPAAPGGAVKIARKGWGMFDVAITGRAAHAGNDHANGVNAVEEMAHQVLCLQGMTNYERGTTVSVGEVKGGNSYNVVPDKATAKVDLRASTMVELTAATEKILGLQPVLAKTSVSVTGTINRPPLEATPANLALYERAKQIAAHLGFGLGMLAVGGVSDGNFTSAIGVPTLDGLGADGEGAHAVNECLIIDAMPKRAALLAAMMGD